MTLLLTPDVKASGDFFALFKFVTGWEFSLPLLHAPP